MKKTFTIGQKARVAIEAIKGLKTTNELSTEYGVHPTQVGLWKKKLLDNAKDLFGDKRNTDNKTKDETIERLYTVIGKRETELDWLKKKLHIDN